MSASTKVTKLESGLTIVTDAMPQLRTASLGIWVNFPTAALSPVAALTSGRTRCRRATAPSRATVASIFRCP